MGSVPRHPFFLKVIDALPRYDRSWFLPYITVMGSTGPLFLSIIWRHYNSYGPVEESERVRILFPDEYNKHSWSFFRYHVGNSWHQKDVQLILWVCNLTLLPSHSLTYKKMSRHWILLTALGFVTAGVVFTSLWYLYGRLLVSNSPKGQSFRRKQTYFFWSHLPTLSSLGFSKESTLDYDLIRRYEEDRLEA